MLMRKNVNSDVSKDRPITTVIKLMYWEIHEHVQCVQVDISNVIFGQDIWTTKPQTLFNDILQASSFESCP